MARPTKADLRAFEAAVGPARLDPTARDEVAARLQVREVARREHVLRAGEPAHAVWFVVRGVLREYFPLADGTERTKAFVVEGQASGSLADLLSGTASRASIVAEEPVRALMADWSALRELGRRHPSLAAAGRAHTEALLLRKAQREYELLALDAEGRYAAFAATYPGLEARVAGMHVASYLGITAVHLSRLRRRRAARGSSAPATG